MLLVWVLRHRAIAMRPSLAPLHMTMGRILLAVLLLTKRTGANRVGQGQSRLRPGPAVADGPQGSRLLE